MCTDRDPACTAPDEAGPELDDGSTGAPTWYSEADAGGHATVEVSVEGLDAFGAVESPLWVHADRLDAMDRSHLGNDYVILGNLPGLCGRLADLHRADEALEREMWRLSGVGWPDTTCAEVEQPVADLVEAAGRIFEEGAHYLLIEFDSIDGFDDLDELDEGIYRVSSRSYGLRGELSYPNGNPFAVLAESWDAEEHGSGTITVPGLVFDFVFPGCLVPGTPVSNESLSDGDLVSGLGKLVEVRPGASLEGTIDAGTSDYDDEGTVEGAVAAEFLVNYCEIDVSG